eukprot:COSAG01_NODE_69611_length_257_cov_0.518519_2_plen_63_part_01
MMMCAGDDDYEEDGVDDEGPVAGELKGGIGVRQRAEAGGAEQRVQGKGSEDDGRTTHECVRCV